MIVQALCDLLFTLFSSLFSWVQLPAFPEGLSSSINSFLDTVFGNLGVLGLFVRWDTVKIALPVVLVIINLDKVYSLVMWIIKKIPFLGVK